MSEKSLLRLLPDTRRRTPIVIPDWLRDYANSWREQGAAAVVLFGSRGLGFALFDSDWDVAVLFDRKDNAVPNSAGMEFTNWNCQRLELNPVIRNIDEVSPSFAREISKGVLLVGDFASLYQEPDEEAVFQMNKEELVNHLTFTLYNAIHNLSIVSDLWLGEGNRKPLNELYIATPTSASANSAERCVKALCCLLEIDYDHTHNVAKLAEKIPEEWHRLVLRMNRTTGAGHVSSYALSPIEDCKTGVQRVGYALELSAQILEDDRCNLNAEDREKMRKETLRLASAPLNILSRTDLHPLCADIMHSVLRQFDRSGDLASALGLENPGKEPRSD